MSRFVYSGGARFCFSLCNLCVLCVSVVVFAAVNFTTELSMRRWRTTEHEKLIFEIVN